MTRPPSSASRSVPPWGLLVTAMLSVQLGSALSPGLIEAVGAAGTAWLRLSLGAVILIVIARPPLRAIRRRDVLPILGLGCAHGLIAISFLAAIEHIPLGTAVAIEFLGPLTIAALRSHRRRALIWPAMASLGVTLLTQPWQGEFNLTGVGFALVAAVGWAVYLVLTQRIGDRFEGVGALSLTVPVAALTAAIVGIPQAAGHLTPGILVAAAGLALLLPVIPSALEMLSLKRMTPNAVGTLMALQPALGILLGLLILHQHPSGAQLVGVLLVVFAGAAAQRGGERRPPLQEQEHRTAVASANGDIGPA